MTDLAAANAAYRQWLESLPAAPAPAQLPEPEPAPASAAIPATPKVSIANEEKIARLKKALEGGKISQEMYDLNIKKLQG